MTETFDQVAARLQAEWAAAFRRADWPAVAALYTPDTAFYGSTPALRDSPAGVLTYFEGLPHRFISAQYAAPHILALAPGVFAASGGVVFTVSVDGVARERPYRMTQVFRLTPDGWRIAVHHASPVPG